MQNASAFHMKKFVCIESENSLSSFLVCNDIITIKYDSAVPGL